MNDSSLCRSCFKIVTAQRSLSLAYIEPFNNSLKIIVRSSCCHSHSCFSFSLSLLIHFYFTLIWLQLTICKKKNHNHIAIIIIIITICKNHNLTFTRSSLVFTEESRLQRHFFRSQTTTTKSELGKITKSKPLAAPDAIEVCWDVSALVDEYSCHAGL